MFFSLEAFGELLLYKIFIVCVADIFWLALANLRGENQAAP